MYAPCSEDDIFDIKISFNFILFQKLFVRNVISRENEAAGYSRLLLQKYFRKSKIQRLVDTFYTNKIRSEF